MFIERKHTRCIIPAAYEIRYIMSVVSQSDRRITMGCMIMCNLRLVRQCIDGRSFFRMIRSSAWPRPKMLRHDERPCSHPTHHVVMTSPETLKHALYSTGDYYGTVLYKWIHYHYYYHHYYYYYHNYLNRGLLSTLISIFVFITQSPVLYENNTSNILTFGP